MKSVLSKDVKRLTAVFFAALFAAFLLTGCVTIKVKVKVKRTNDQCWLQEDRKLVRDV